MSRLYSIFDQAHLGASLQLSNSDQVVTTTANGLSLSRLARCLYGMDVFSGNVEWLVYGTGTVSISTVAVGVCDASAATNVALGADTHSYAFRSDGALRNNNTTVATDITANPQISPGSEDGQELMLVGRSDTYPVIFEDGTGLKLNGTWTAYADSTLHLRWDTSAWVEVTRNGL